MSSSISAEQVVETESAAQSVLPLFTQKSEAPSPGLALSASGSSVSITVAGVGQAVPIAIRTWPKLSGWKLEVSLWKPPA